MSGVHTPGPMRYEPSPGEPNRGRIVGERTWVASILHNGEAMPARQEADGRLWAAAPEGAQAAENTVAYYAAVEPGRVCLVDNLNPCGGLRHWGGGIGCPLCSARAVLAKAYGSAS